MATIYAVKLIEVRPHAVLSLVSRGQTLFRTNRVWPHETILSHVAYALLVIVSDPFLAGVLSSGSCLWRTVCMASD